MANTPFNEPNVRLDRIYTRTGDEGQTSLAGGQRVGKDDLRIECYGVVDELNAVLGLACVSAMEISSSIPALGDLANILKRVQHELFNLGSILATRPEDVRPRQPRVTGAEVSRLEREIDQVNSQLPRLSSFVLPGGSTLNAQLHVCRTVCRRAERAAVQLSRTEPVPPEVLQYLNRLSDALFVWSRWANHAMGVEETLWQPNLAASGE